MAESYINIEKLDFVTNKLNALANPDRIAIIELLQRKGKASVAEIIAHMNLSQASTSKYLRILKANHIVIAKRAGHNVIYSINHIVVAEIITSISKCS